MDKEIVGYWRVCRIDMIPGKAVSLIGGLPDEVVEFAAAGKYILWGDPSRPMESLCGTSAEGTAKALDVWIKGLGRLVSRCLYEIEGDKLTICIAGDHRARPTAIKRDDGRRWCVMTMQRCDPPPKRKRRPQKRLLEPGSLIPKELFGGTKNRKRKQ